MSGAMKGNMTPQELATRLAGATYRNVISREIAAEAKASGLVVVYGQSDDLMEFDGAIRDEVGCYDGGTAYLDVEGILPDRESIDDDEELKKYFQRQSNAVAIEAIWSAEGYSWIYKTSIPHATFEVTEDGDPSDKYCRGIVFALADAKP